MRYTAAIEAHIDAQYADHVRMHTEPDAIFTDPPLSREAFVGPEWGCAQFAIAREVATRVAHQLGELVTFGVFDNCREHGITVTGAGGWTFCVYEHRNSDNICIEGCPTAEVQSYGPYGGRDKWDTLFSTRDEDYDGAAAAMVAMINLTVERGGKVTRGELTAATNGLGH